MLALAHLKKEEEKKMRNFRIWPISVLPLCEGCRASKHILAFRKACKNDCKHSEPKILSLLNYEVLIDNTLDRAAMFFFRPSILIEYYRTL